MSNFSPPFFFFFQNRTYASIVHRIDKYFILQDAPFVRRKIFQTRFSYVRHTNPRTREQKRTRNRRLTRRNVISRIERPFTFHPNFPTFSFLPSSLKKKKKPLFIENAQIRRKERKKERFDSSSCKYRIRIKKNLSEADEVRLRFKIKERGEFIIKIKLSFDISMHGLLEQRLYPTISRFVERSARSLGRPMDSGPHFLCSCLLLITVNAVCWLSGAAVLELRASKIFFRKRENWLFKPA